MTTVVVVDDAEQQFREIVDWWRTNRPAAPSLPLDEYDGPDGAVVKVRE